MSVEVGSLANSLHGRLRVIARYAESWCLVQVQYIDGLTKARPNVLHEASLSEVVLPQFDPGDEVRIGSIGRKGVVLERIEQPGHPVRYRVGLEAEVRRSRRGDPGWLNEPGDVLVGPENINII